MKRYTLIILTTLVFSVLYGCKKQNIQPTAPKLTMSSLVAKWSIAKDSVTTRFMDTVTHYNVYVGSADDYYDFRTDGKCYIHENGTFDTMTYKIATDTSVAFEGQYSSPINSLTNHSVKIDFFRGMTPGGGYYSRIISLKK